MASDMLIFIIILSPIWEPDKIKHLPQVSTIILLPKQNVLLRNVIFFLENKNERIEPKL